MKLFQNTKYLIGWTMKLFDLRNFLFFGLFFMSDINECQDGTAKCSANMHCENFEGGYVALIPVEQRFTRSF